MSFGLWNVLEQMGVPTHFIMLISNLYDDSKTVVRLDDTTSTSNCFQCIKGVRPEMHYIIGTIQ